MQGNVLLQSLVRPTIPVGTEARAIHGITNEVLAEAPYFSQLHDTADIEQVLREKKSFTLRCILDRLKELQGRVGPWNRFASSVSITSACLLL
jgi:DNA polymerase III subunit epsilon